MLFGFFFVDVHSAMSAASCQLRNIPYERIKAAPEALKAIKAITGTIGITSDFSVIGGKFLEKTPIAAAFICQNKRHILYDVDHYNWFGTGATDWRTFGILIHEVAHHAENHIMVDNKPQKRQELEADYLAGFISGRLGATRKEASSFTDFVGETGSDTHPPRKQRKEAAIRGWEAAQRQKKWEQAQCIQSEWSGDQFSIGVRKCRMINLCSGGKITQRVACKSSNATWILQ